MEYVDVFDAVRRGYSELNLSSDAEIIEYFSEIEDESITGHISNIKGILFEQQYVQYLHMQDVDASLFALTNYPNVDVSIFEGGISVSELQLKATDSVSYINETIYDNPDISVVVTSEVASSFASDQIIDSGISNFDLTSQVSDALFSGRGYSDELGGISYPEVGEALDLVDGALDLALAGVGAVGVVAAFSGVKAAIDDYKDNGDIISATGAGVGATVVGAGKTAVNTVKLGASAVVGTGKLIGWLLKR